MLIVIVIIGILSAALIPRVLGVQARARDTARSADMRSVSTAIESYGLDNHGIYPLAPFWEQNNISGSILSISGNISTYLTALPIDSKNGLSTTVNGDCYKEGEYFAYYSNQEATKYAITSTKESRKGNAMNCRGIKTSYQWKYETYGYGLTSWQFITDNQLWLWWRYGVAAAGYSGPTGSIILSNDTSKFVTMTTNSFRNRWLTHVFIPNGVTIIWSYSFLENQITSIIIPKTVTIVDYGSFMRNGVNRNSDNLGFTWNDGTDQSRILNGKIWQRTK